MSLPASVVLLFAQLFVAPPNSGVRILVNQVGFAPRDLKIAVVASDRLLADRTFHLAAYDGSILHTGTLTPDEGTYLATAHHYRADFTSFTRPGDYRLLAGGMESHRFAIGPQPGAAIPDSLLRFFQIQRCGYVRIPPREPCHPYDATALLGGEAKRPPDLTGGWHDAGDYTKFLQTTAVATHRLAVAYLLNPSRFGISSGKPSSHLIEELKWGVEWLGKAHFREGWIAVQVQDSTDHSVGWRLPEKDPLSRNRPVWIDDDPAHLGLFSAAMAAASQAFSRSGESRLSVKALKEAEAGWREAWKALREGRVIADDAGRRYRDPHPEDNLMLAAVELHFATGKDPYLQVADSLFAAVQPGYWVSWGDMAGIAAARASSISRPAQEFAERLLSHYDSLAARNPFAYPLESFPWGSAASQTGIANFALLYELTTGDERGKSLAIRQRDYLLGANPFGVSFVAGFGTDFSRSFHHQVTYLSGISLPGGVAEGPIDSAAFASSGIVLAASDRFARLQSKSAVYHDDRNDYLTNEPTVYQAAETLLLFTALNLPRP
ncbi:MAG: hypothetical protein FJY67_04505 [Calditrichaeota bacterium]|nr:hypothetical protein [Calditrichota bacterium]